MEKGAVRTNKDIKVSIIFTEGYQKRFTEACLQEIKRREEEKQISAGAEIA